MNNIQIPRPYWLLMRGNTLYAWYIKPSELLQPIAQRTTTVLEHGKGKERTYNRAKGMNKGPLWCWIELPNNSQGHKMLPNHSKIHFGQVRGHFGQVRRVYVRRRKGERYKNECLLPTLKHGGGSIMVCGAISAAGTGDLVKIDGIMDKKVYHNILVRHGVPSGSHLIGQGFIFQEDKACIQLL